MSGPSGHGTRPKSRLAADVGVATPSPNTTLKCTYGPRRASSCSVVSPVAHLSPSRQLFPNVIYPLHKPAHSLRPYCCDCMLLTVVRTSTAKNRRPRSRSQRTVRLPPVTSIDSTKRKQALTVRAHVDNARQEQLESLACRRRCFDCTASAVEQRLDKVTDSWRWRFVPVTLLQATNGTARAELFTLGLARLWTFEARGSTALFARRRLWPSVATVSQSTL
jgi:hypothetical protein